MAAPFLPQPGSPLLQLPGELRNKIIRYIFKQEDYILLVPWVGPTHPLAPVTTCAIPDIEVFTVCRQLHNEARTSFLSVNTFMLSTSYNAYTDAATAGFLTRWMSSLGPYRDYVRKVVVDLSPVISYPARNWVNLRPIMTEIWRYQAIPTNNGHRQRANIDISFAFSGRQLRAHVAHPAVIRPTIDASRLNAMVTLLTPQRSPEMSAYLQSPRTLLEIRTNVDGLQSLFMLAAPHNQDYTDSPIIQYNISSSGQLERHRIDRNQGVGIDRLIFTKWVCETLLDMLVDSNTSQRTYNIESRTVSRRLPEAFSINKRFRELAMMRYPNLHVVGTLTSYSAQASFGNLKSMEDWCMATRVFLHGEPGDEQNNPPTILTRFELSGREDLSDLRIPVTNIIMATLHLPLNTELRVELARPDVPVRVKTAILYRIQRQLFVFLADILDFFPNRSAETCPEVMMDGNCVIDSVEYEGEDGSKFQIRNDKPDMDSGQMENEMDSHITQLIELDDVDISAYVSTIRDEGRYDMDAPHHPSLRGAATKLACFLHEAGTADGYYT